MNEIKYLVIYLFKSLMTGRFNWLLRTFNKQVAFVTVYLCVALFNLWVFAWNRNYILTGAIDEGVFFILFILVFLPAIFATAVVLSISRSEKSSHAIEVDLEDQKRILKKRDYLMFLVIFVFTGTCCFSTYIYMNGWEVAYENMTEDISFDLIVFVFIPMLLVSYGFSYMYEFRKSEQERKCVQAQEKQSEQ